MLHTAASHSVVPYIYSVDSAITYSLQYTCRTTIFQVFLLARQLTLTYSPSRHEHIKKLLRPYRTYVDRTEPLTSLFIYDFVI